MGVRRETVWRWRQDPSFASEVSVRQGQRRQSIHDELDAGVIESVQMLRGLVADTDAPPGARHSADHAQQQVTQHAFKDPEDLAREILRVLPTVMAVLSADEVRSHLSQLRPLVV